MGDTISGEFDGARHQAGAHAEAGDDVRVGSTIGRYVVVGHLGQGSMGIVLAGYDPRLERKVALKLLRPEAVGNAALRARLLREARAHAQLTHPNVVHVHDVGDLGESVFIAMGFVEGTTLSRWLQPAKAGYRQVLEVFLMAGRGLAAAHAAGPGAPRLQA